MNYIFIYIRDIYDIYNPFYVTMILLCSVTWPSRFETDGMEHVFITCSVSLIGMAWDEQQRCTNFVRASWLEAIVFLKAALLPCRPGVVGPC